MTIYLFGLNEVTWEILENPDWPASASVEGLVNKKYFDEAQKLPIKVNILEEISLKQGDEIINCVGYKSLLDRESVSTLLAGIARVRTYISPRASVSKTALILDGTVILGNAVVERGVIIGSGSLIWGGAYICHDAKIGPFNFIASGVRVGGWATTGKFCKFGFNSVLEQHSKVPDNFSSGALRFLKKTRGGL